MFLQDFTNVVIKLIARFFKFPINIRFLLILHFKFFRKIHLHSYLYLHWLSFSNLYYQYY